MARLQHKNVLFFLSLLIFTTSCQKNHIPNQGHFTHYQFEIKGGRTIASVAVSDQTMDPKQIYLDCKFKSEHELKNCFEEQLSQRQLTANYEETQTEVEKIADKIVLTLLPELNKYAEDRNEFCQKNSTLSFEKCLYQFIEKETIEIANLYQKSHKDLNGQEYLFIKEKISNKYKELLANYNEKQHQAEIKKIDTIVGHHFSKVEQKLLASSEWIKGHKFLPACHDYCVQFAVKELKHLVSSFYQEELSKNSLIEEKCSDILSHEKVLSEINYNTNLAIEQEVTYLSQKIGEKTLGKSIQCFQEKRIYDSEIQAKRMLEECIFESFSEESQNIFSNWKQNQKENSFFAKNPELIMAKIKIPSNSLKRDIASKLEGSTNP